MKKIILLFFSLALATDVFAQKERALPQVDVKTLDGKIVSTKSFSNEGKPIIISFWATWCKPCIAELANIHDQYEQWQQETGVKLIAISVDDARNNAKVLPAVQGRGWEYEVYLDANADFKRAMNVNNIPHTFLLNGKNEIVWQHNSYAEGSEKELFELVKKVAKGEPVGK